jgi:hypothetical protein
MSTTKIEPTQTTLYHRAMAGVMPRLYRRAPYTGMTQHILDFERKRNNPKTPEEAKKISTVFRQRSLIAKRENKLDDAILRFDEITKLWGGWETPPVRESLGIERNTARGEQSKNSYRTKFGQITARSKCELLDEIMSIENCDLVRAEQIFVTCRTNKSKLPVFLYHKATNTWRGCFANEPDIDDAVERATTNKQEEYRLLFAPMPWLNHDQRKLEESDAIKWVMQRETSFSFDEAKRKIDRAFTCSKNKAKISIRSRTCDGFKQIGGRDYVEPFPLTDEICDKIRKLDPIQKEYYRDEICKRFSILPEQIEQVIGQIRDRKLCAIWSMTVIDTGNPCEAVVGEKYAADFTEKELAQKQEDESRKAQAEKDRTELRRREQDKSEMQLSAFKNASREERFEMLKGEAKRCTRLPRLEHSAAMQWVSEHCGSEHGSHYILAAAVHFGFITVQGLYWQGKGN